MAEPGENLYKNDPELYGSGLAMLRKLCQDPFEHYSGYMVSDTTDTGIPYIFTLEDSANYEPSPDVVYVGESTLGTLSEVRWPDFNIEDMAVVDDTPIVEYQVPHEQTPNTGILAQLTIKAVLDKGALGPFRSGHFIWNRNGQVVYYLSPGTYVASPGYLPVGMTLDDGELSDLNRAIGDAHNRNPAFEGMNVATVLGHISCGRRFEPNYIK